MGYIKVRFRDGREVIYSEYMQRYLKEDDNVVWIIDYYTGKLLYAAEEDKNEI